MRHTKTSQTLKVSSEEKKKAFKSLTTDLNPLVDGLGNELELHRYYRRAAMECYELLERVEDRIDDPNCPLEEKNTLIKEAPELWEWIRDDMKKVNSLTRTIQGEVSGWDWKKIKKGRPKGQDKKTKATWQEIVDKAYEGQIYCEEYDQPITEIYHCLAEEYNLSWTHIKNIVNDTTYNLTPTALK